MECGAYLELEAVERSRECDEQKADCRSDGDIAGRVVGLQQAGGGGEDHQGIVHQVDGEGSVGDAAEAVEPAPVTGFSRGVDEQDCRQQKGSGDDASGEGEEGGSHRLDAQQLEWVGQMDEGGEESGDAFGFGDEGRREQRQQAEGGKAHGADGKGVPSNEPDKVVDGAAEQPDGGQEEDLRAGDGGEQDEGEDAFGAAQVEEEAVTEVVEALVGERPEGDVDERDGVVTPGLADESQVEEDAGKRMGGLRGEVLGVVGGGQSGAGDGQDDGEPHGGKGDRVDAGGAVDEVLAQGMFTRQGGMADDEAGEYEEDGDGDVA